jgi:hypothetical protein
LQRGLHRVDHGDVDAAGAGRGGDLAADPAGTDDRQVLHVPQPVGEVAAVVQRPECDHASELTLAERQSPWTGVGREEQPVERQLLAVARPDRPGVAIERHDGVAGDHLDVVIGVKVRVVDAGVVVAFLAEEHALRQWRAFVGQMRFVREERHGPVEAVAPDGLGGLSGGEAAAHEHDPADVAAHVDPSSTAGG